MTDYTESNMNPPDELLEIRQCACGNEFDIDPFSTQPQCETCRPSRPPPLPEDQPITDTPNLFTIRDEVERMVRGMYIEDVVPTPVKKEAKK